LKNLHTDDVGDRGLFIALISAHGLIRGEDPELGRDADTGGQVQYVLDLARTLSKHPEVDRVELMTRQILSTNVDYRYGEHREQIADRAWIIRIPFGPHRYLYKESLWPYLPQFVDGALLHFRQVGRFPDLVHGHYADAGEIGLDLGKLLGVPVAFTGHSLGRVKQQRLLEKGTSAETIEDRYNISRRIRAEERVLEHADLIVASTRQEVSEQYGMYDTDGSQRMVVIPPGVDLSRFRPPTSREDRPGIADAIDRFLADPVKPLILAVQRPDERKNLATLIRAYGENGELRKVANLALLIGARDDITSLGRSQRKVLTEMLHLIDLYDLYGSVAYPKRHSQEDVDDVYRLAARRRGVFVNPALTEPFGLTLIEAAASGLPIVATEDGGPREIVELCGNGVLVDPLDSEAIASALLEVLTDKGRWRQLSRAGIKGAHSHFSWKGHVNNYVKEVRRTVRRHHGRLSTAPGALLLKDDLLVCDIDNTLTGDREALAEFSRWLEAHRDRVAFGVATGRVLTSALRALSEWEIPNPDVLITAVGSEIYYGEERQIEDLGWRNTIDFEWYPEKVRECLQGVPGLRLQPKKDQRRFKISYFVDTDAWPGVAALRRQLKADGLNVSTIFSHDRFLDVLPVRATKGRALSYVARRWGFAPDHVIAAGDSGNDTAMLKSAARGLIVGNLSPELRSLRGREGVYFADANHAAGILEGLEHSGVPSSPPTAAAGQPTASKGERG